MNAEDRLHALLTASDPAMADEAFVARVAHRLEPREAPASPPMRLLQAVAAAVAAAGVVQLIVEQGPSLLAAIDGEALVTALALVLTLWALLRASYRPRLAPVWR